MNRRDVLKSSAVLAGGLGLPFSSISRIMAQDEEPTPPPPPPVNTNVVSSYVDSLRTAHTALAAAGISAADLSAWATSLSTLSAELSSTGHTAQIQAYLLANPNAVNDWEPSSAGNSLLVSRSNIVLPTITTAQIAAATSQVNATTKQTLLTSGGVADSLSNGVSYLQNLATTAVKMGGVYRPNSVGISGPVADYSALIVGLIAVGTVCVVVGALIVAPEVIAVVPLIGEVTDAGAFGATGATMLGVAGIDAAGGYGGCDSMH